MIFHTNPNELLWLCSGSVGLNIIASKSLHTSAILAKCIETPKTMDNHKLAYEKKM